MSGIFRDSWINDRLLSDGFVSIPLLGESELNELRLLYQNLPPVESKGTYVTMFNPSFEYRRKVDSGIKEICGDTVRSFMIGYRPLYANFMVKPGGPEGDFPVHQDWTYVDESKFISIAFWIPLEDVNDINGALHVVRGSHRFLTQLRGPYVHEPFAELSQKIKSEYSIPINLKAGEALIWDHRLIHFSLPNLTEVSRVAVTLIMVPETGNVIHCYGVPESAGVQIEKFSVDTDFYMSYTIGKRPENALLIETIMQPVINFTEEEFAELYKQPNSRQPKR